MTGTASVPGREFDLKGTAKLTTSDASSGFELPFMVQGPWDDPLIFPDPDALLRRSPATAPFLEKLKDEKTRDAVRSVIERLTGSGKAPPAAPTNAPAAADAKAN
jgi:AsmA protein